MKKTHIIGIGNHKGGTCKTTTAMHLAAALGERGRKCLVIDLDGNLGLTRSFDIPLTSVGTFHMLTRQEHAEDVVITASDCQERASRPGEMIKLPKNVDVIPASRRIEKFDKEYEAAAEQERELQYIAPIDTLSGPLEELNGRYDYIFLDTPPKADTLTIAAYKAAEWFILSSTAEKLSVDAIARSMHDIIAASTANPRLRVLGAVMSQVDARRKLQRTYVSKVARDLEGAGGFGLFETVIPSRAVIGMASALCVTVFDYDPVDHEVKSTNEMRDLYRSLAREVEDRVIIEANQAIENVGEAISD